MDRIEIKKRAREIANKNKWNIWKPVLIIMLLEGIAVLLVQLLNLDKIVASFITSLVSIFLIPASVFGVMAYDLKIARGEEPDISILLKQYKRYSNLLWITIICSVIIFLWSLLLLIPGIIVAISYSMYSYITYDEPDLEGKEVLDRSKELMNGYKKDYFIFLLSFIGWILLSLLIIPMAFTIPYISIANALYYDELKKERNM